MQLKLPYCPTMCDTFHRLAATKTPVITVQKRNEFHNDVYVDGRSSCIEIALKTTMNENFYLSTPNAIQMAVHSPFMMVNPFTDGFSIRPCTTYKMQLQKNLETMDSRWLYGTQCWIPTVITIRREDRRYPHVHHGSYSTTQALSQEMVLFE
ncbi:hypothetical protein TNCV_4845641 [Trichonephila clavipes]|uniref:Uncharacterized protein n=1 Tax=Trichonephila clavipes TaxID=2585209 RepID=A0A8X6WKJ2_TRICX|nr:hypothetical protein TNCV_4845641 [Trichonephila clavipes]